MCNDWPSISIVSLKAPSSKFNLKVDEDPI